MEHFYQTLPWERPRRRGRKNLRDKGLACHKMPSSGHDLSITLMTSQQPIYLHKIKPAKLPTYTGEMLSNPYPLLRCYWRCSGLKRDDLFSGGRIVLFLMVWPLVDFSILQLMAPQPFNRSALIGVSGLSQGGRGVMKLGGVCSVGRYRVI